MTTIEVNNGHDGNDDDDDDEDEDDGGGNVDDNVPNMETTPRLDSSGSAPAPQRQRTPSVLTSIIRHTSVRFERVVVRLVAVLQRMWWFLMRQ